MEAATTAEPCPPRLAVSPPCFLSCSGSGCRQLRRSRSWPVSTSTRLHAFSPEWLDFDAIYGVHRPAVSQDSLAWGTPLWDTCCSYIEYAWTNVLHDIIIVYLTLQRPAYRLKTVHIHAICHLLLLVVSIAFAFIQLRGVLLPVLLAAGIAVLLEPIIFLLIDPWVRCFRERPRIQGIFNDSLQFIGIEIGGSSVPTAPSRLNATCIPVCGTERAISSIFRRFWCVMAVALTIGGLLTLVTSIGVWTFASVKEVKWGKYFRGQRLAWLQEQLVLFGINDFETAMREAGVLVVQELGLRIIDSTMSALTGFLLIILFLGFFLIDSASERSVGKEPWRPVQRKIMKQVAQRVPSSNDSLSESVLWIKDDLVPLAATLFGRLRLQMRVYIRAKCHLSVLKATLIGGLLALLDVDLWVIWTLLTFVLNFVPLGSALSTFAPIPFVFLDPSKEFWMVVVCVFWPILVHNIVGNIVEPRVFANTLSLHPITVLLALTFWTALLGVTGALVCVPLTAMIRVGLKEASGHPYAAVALGLIEGVLVSTVEPVESLDRISFRSHSTRDGNPTGKPVNSRQNTPVMSRQTSPRSPRVNVQK